MKTLRLTDISRTMVVKKKKRHRSLWIEERFWFYIFVFLRMLETCIFYFAWKNLIEKIYS